MSVWDTMARVVGHDGRGARDVMGGAHGMRRAGRVGRDGQGAWDAMGGCFANGHETATNHPMALSPIQMALLVLCIAPAILVETREGPRRRGWKFIRSLCMSK